MTTTTKNNISRRQEVVKATRRLKIGGEKMNIIAERQFKLLQLLQGVTTNLFYPFLIPG